MICPKCEEGSIEKVKVKLTGEILSICDFCHSIWTEEECIQFNTGHLLDFYIDRKDHQYTIENSQNISQGHESIYY